MLSSIAILFAAAFVGHPVGVTCDTTAPPGVVVPAGYMVEGWAFVGGAEIHIHPTACAALNSPDPATFARGFNVLAHETWHAHGEADEGCAETFARYAVFDLMPRFWRMTSDTMLAVAKSVSDYTLLKPAAYNMVGEDGCLNRILKGTT